LVSAHIRTLLKRSRVISKLDFSGQVAVVTGGGRGLGRAYALSLAKRGAAIVVNDIGSDAMGKGRNDELAAATVQEIRSRGGRAVASADSVATPEGGAALVEGALGAFGKIDILIHNAGVVRTGPFAEASIDDVQAVLNTHLLAAWHVGQPAWRHMAARGYGRVILTSSNTVFGREDATAYGAAKAAIIGLAKGLRQEGDPLGIRVNVVCPLAASRLGGSAQEVFGDLADPDLAAAVVVYLASTACALSGEVLQAGGSHVARLFLGESSGWAKRSSDLTPEEVEAHLPEILDISKEIIPDKAQVITDHIKRMVLGSR
jgi:NAD(P)-dependent dehydrogenase (short-subunit alcohol dehydrogenase family)